MPDSLTVAVETLYAVFARYPLPARVHYCDHCVDPMWVEALHGTPLRQADAAQMRPLLGNVPYTWGDEEYANHLLPRLLELVASGVMNDSSYPVFMSSWLWPWRHGEDEERHAIDGFMHAWWRETMSTAPSACEPWDLLNTLESCDEDPRPFLDGWPAEAGAPAARQLAELIGDLSPVVVIGGTFSDAINRWLLGPFPIEFLTRHLAATDPVLARCLERVDCVRLCYDSTN